MAHLGYFRSEYIEKRKWVDDRTYADLVALCQFLPGPASSQVGISIGIIRGGMVGGFLSWLGFTLPSILALVCFAFLLHGVGVEDAGWIDGLKVVAVAVVAQAVLGMGKALTPDRGRISIAIAAALVMFLWPTAVGQIGLIAVSGIVGLLLYKRVDVPELKEMAIAISKKVAILAWILFFALLILLPIVRSLFASPSLALFDTFYRVGSLVFGGGHVVLPLLEREVVPVGWVSEDAFLAGYGTAQAIPGPLFTFASYLGAMIDGWQGAFITTAAIFLPSFLLVIGSLPFWDAVRKKPRVQAALRGVNAAVVGILLAALYDPLWTSAIQSTADFGLALISFVMLVFWKVPPWIVVIFAALGGMVFAMM